MMEFSKVWLLWIPRGFWAHGNFSFLLQCLFPRIAAGNTRNSIFFRRFINIFPTFLLRKASSETRNSTPLPCGCYCLPSQEFLWSGFIQSGIFQLYWEYSSNFCLKISSWGDLTLDFFGDNMENLGIIKIQDILELSAL